jgi:hypothetical protein
MIEMRQNSIYTYGINFGYTELGVITQKGGIYYGTVIR